MAKVQGSSLVTVSCASHCEYVAIALRNMFDSKRGADFDFVWGGKSIRAHRIILELFLRSEVINSVSSMANSVKYEVLDDGDDCGNNILDSMVEFLYKGEVALPEAQLDDLLRVAREFNFEMLVDAIIQQFYSPEVIEIDTDGVDAGGCAEVANSSFGFKVEEVGIPPIDLNESLALGSCRVDLGSRICDYDQRIPTCKSEHKIGKLTNPKGLNHFMDGFEPINFEPHSVVEFPNSDQLQLLGSGIKLEPDDASFEPPSGVPGGSIGSYEESMPRDEDDGGASRVFILDSGTSDESDSKEVAQPVVTKRYKCLHCKFETVNFKAYRIHLFKLHGLTTRGKPAPKCKCAHCEFEATTYLKYCQHLVAAHGITIEGKPACKFKCTHCDYEATARTTYYTHLRSIHQLTVRGEPAVRHDCPECDYSTFILGRLTLHLSTKHSKDKNYACPLCSYAGKQMLYLRRHMNAVHGEGHANFTCETCSQRCVSRSSLERHIRTHTNERPFKCTFCDFASKLKNDLKNHVRSVHRSVDQAPDSVDKVPESVDQVPDSVELRASATGPPQELTAD